MKPYMEDMTANYGLRKRICEDILTERFSHAYIIEGAVGSGKHTVAKLTAAALSCERKSDPNEPIPCTKCDSCSKVLRGLSPDLINVSSEGKATLGIDKVRFLKEDVYIPPNDLERKIYVIEDADRLTVQAQNAFLLTLEEPPAYAVFLLLCQSSDLLLETIRSRAPTLRTEPIPNELIDSYIVSHDQRAAAMKQSSPRDYNELIMASKNGIGNALKLLDKKLFDGIISQRKLAKDFIDLSLSRKDPQRALALMARFSTKRDGLSEELTAIYSALRDLIASKKSETLPLCFYESRDDAIELSDRVSIKRLFTIMDITKKAIEKNSLNANVRLTVTSLFSECDMI